MQKQITLIFLAVIAISNAKAMDAPSWSGDLRYRNERIDQDNKDARFRNRIRARLKVAGKAQEDLSYAFRIASGSSDPVSSNQTLDGGFSSKGINLDLAYLKYTTDFGHLVAGKMKNPWAKPAKTELVWDGDLSPEGLAYHLPIKMLFVNLGYLWVDERSTSPDAVLQGLQLGIQHSGDLIQFTYAIAYYDYLSTQGESTFVDTADSFGNSTNAASKYDNDYNLINSFVEVKFKTKVPFTLFADFVTNIDPKKNDGGYLAGFNVGKKFKLSYNYRKVEQDAVIGAFTDSDFAGGGTNAKGHELGLGYSFNKKTKVAFSHFLNKTASLTNENYTRSMLDFSLKF